MKLIDFLKDNKLSINALAVASDIPATTVWRAASGRPLRPCNALRIQEATGGAVTVMDLLYPEQKTEGRPKAQARQHTQRPSL